MPPAYWAAACTARIGLEAAIRSGMSPEKRWNTRIELANAMFEHLEIWHNRQRRHSAVGWLSPVEFETRSKIVAV